MSGVEMGRASGNSLADVVDGLGPAVLRLIAGTADRAARGVSVLDPIASGRPGPDALVLGIGIASAASAIEALPALGAGDVAALLVKPPAATGPAVEAAAEAAGVSLVEVGPDVAWEQLIILLRRLLEPGGPRRGRSGPQDLFQLANEIAALIEAPITIEDRAFRVLAFSGGQEDTDEGRVRTVLGRRVPDSYQEMLAETGVLDELATSTDPVFVPVIEPGGWPRMAISVRAGNTVLGSVWAVVSEPLTGQRRQTFHAAAEIVALHLLHERAVTDTASSLRAGQLAALLDRGGDPRAAARSLGVDGIAVCVVAIGFLDATGDREAAAGRAAELQRITDAVGLHLRLMHQGSAVVALGETIYGLVPAADEATAQRVVDEFLTRPGTRRALRAGIGRVAHDPAEVAASRSDADDVLRVVRRGVRADARSVAAGAVWADLMILRLADGERSLRADSVVAQLKRHDAENSTDFAGSLGAYLDAFGDVGKAAASLHIHPNTFRYRLSRIGEITGADLADPGVRLAAMIDLRLHVLQE